MKRRLVEQGGTTLMVSLPSKWARRLNLKKGDEVELSEIGRDVVIKTEKDIELERTSIDTTNLNERVIRWLLSGLHKGGYDEIEIIFDRKEVMDIVTELIKDLYMGFAITEQTDKRCVLKNISRDLESEFDTILRRAFLVTVSMGESCLELTKQGKLGKMKELINLEHTNNQLTNFCERILNKKGYRDYRKTCFMYVVAWNLEKVCDDYKYICEYLSVNPMIKPSKELIEIFEMANKQVRGYNSLLSKFKAEDLVELNKNRKAIVEKIKELIKKQKPDEVLILNYLMSLVMKCEDFSTSMFMLNYK